jgi:hypothetical protein
MSYVMPGQGPAAPRRRPGTVTAATWLLLLAALLFVVSGIATLAVSGTLADVYREAYEGYDELEGVAGTLAASDIAVAALRLLFGLGYGVLALFNHRGSNPSRIVTWVAGGLALCCAGAALVSAALLSGVQMEPGQGPDPDEVARMVDAALPDWYTPLTNVATLVMLPALIAVLILLALPPSNVFFRRPPAEPPPGGPSVAYPPPTP